MIVLAHQLRINQKAANGNRLGITDGQDDFKHGPILVEDPSHLPSKGDIVDLGFIPPGAQDENRVHRPEESKINVVYIVRNFKILRRMDNGSADSTEVSDPPTPRSSTPRPSTPEPSTPEPSPLQPADACLRPGPTPATPSSSSADKTPTPNRYRTFYIHFTRLHLHSFIHFIINRPIKRPSYELYNSKTPESSTPSTSSTSTTNGEASDPAPTARRSLFGAAAKERAQQAWKNASVDPTTKASHRVKDLNPYQNKYTILAKVTHKGELNERHTSRWSGFVFNVTLEDASGDIRATAFEEHATKFHPMLDEGKFYFVSHAKVNPIRNKQFNTTSHEFELGLDRNTVIKECTNAPSLRTPSVNLTPIKDIKDKAGGDMVNVLGYCTNIGNLFEGVSGRGKRYKKRDIFLIDQDDDEVKVTYNVTEYKFFQFT